MKRGRGHVTPSQVVIKLFALPSSDDDDDTVRWIGEQKRGSYCSDLMSKAAAVVAAAGGKLLMSIGTSLHELTKALYCFALTPHPLTHSTARSK